MTTIEQFTDRLIFRPPFLLKIDDEEHLIEETAELVNVRDHFKAEDPSDLYPPRIESAPFQGTLTLLVKDRVIAQAAYSRKGPRACDIIKHPDGTFTLQFYKPHGLINLPSK